MGARERRHEDVGVAMTLLVALDMSWLCLRRRYYQEEGGSSTPLVREVISSNFIMRGGMKIAIRTIMEIP